ncbi:MAG: hypothetical protein HC886_18525 [Leptolyngbyaceae cyanobacterium SM1_1_3]|nr:hypothetical protein [Leptolyngbyaceae cyanobacterium SM1_1_3]NJN03275.1 hypothetical protein [Leptolyngbyaceae cyanobacterium RM1_1_2]NJO09545.1 hypothetical protein [Leptolyngbyaceae cyanobacterium SL_1_1]
MLKLIYTENSLYLEHLAQTATAFLVQRTSLSWQMQCDFIVQKSYGAFLLSAHLPELSQLNIAARKIDPQRLSLSTADSDVVEVSLQGYWIAEQPHSSAGLLVAELPAPLEALLFNLWLKTRRIMPLHQVFEH